MELGSIALPAAIFGRASVLLEDMELGNIALPAVIVGRASVQSSGGIEAFSAIATF